LNFAARLWLPGNSAVCYRLRRSRVHLGNVGLGFFQDLGAGVSDNEAFDPIESRKRVDRLAWEAEIYVGIVGTILATGFVILTLGHLPFTEAIKNTNYSYVRDIALAVYYNCWIWGTLFDVGLQKSVYYTDPTNAQFRVASILSVGALLAVGALLVAVRYYDLYFACALTVLVVVNIFVWKHVLSVVEPSIKASEQMYASLLAHSSQESLNWVKNYMTGKWQIWRFAAMLLIATAMIVISINEGMRGLAASLVAWLFPSDVPFNTIKELLPASLFVIFIMVAEGWIWMMRTVTRTAIYTIDQLHSHYNLVKRAQSK
jgi:hypothetical protein